MTWITAPRADCTKKRAASTARLYREHIAIPCPDGSPERAIAEQIKADHGERSWAYTDPRQVAVESLKAYYAGEVPVLRSVKKTPSRQVYRWKKGNDVVVIVVERPYWLSVYASSDCVAWVATTIKQAACD